MELNGVEIEDTFAEAFPIKIARVLITGASTGKIMTPNFIEILELTIWEQGIPPPPRSFGISELRGD